MGDKWALVTDGKAVHLFVGCDHCDNGIAVWYFDAIPELKIGREYFCRACGIRAAAVIVLQNYLVSRAGLPVYDMKNPKHRRKVFRYRANGLDMAPVGDVLQSSARRVAGDRKTE